MQNIDLNKIKHVHFIGIGGIGISALARMMKEEGKVVTGNDLGDFDMVQAVRKIGIEVSIGASKESIPIGVDLFVYSIAWTTLGPELLEYVKSLNIPILTYPEMLGLVSSDKYTIAICGTHGKTTTTGMIATVLKDTEKDPTVVIGSLLSNGTNFVKGKSDVFLTEACEYRRSFLNINPNILVITNIEADHLDYYKDIDDIKDAFHTMVMKVPSDGFVVCNINDENIKDVVSGSTATIIDAHDFYDENLILKVPGLHNKRNASEAIAVASIFSLDNSLIKEKIKTFTGTARRFEYKGELKSGAKVYDDYGHHPTEIKVTLQGFRELYKKEDGYKIHIIFQPHLASRTKSLFSEFAQSFADADKVYLLPIYLAREAIDETISSEILATEINKYDNKTQSFLNFADAEEFLFKTHFTDKDIIVTMGAGEAYKIGDFLLGK